MLHTIKFFLKNKSDRLILYTSAGLFAWQLFHLYWLTTNVVLFRLTGQNYFLETNWIIFFTSLADYVEIPALIIASIFYLKEAQKTRSDLKNSKRSYLDYHQWKNILLLIFINLQWLHLFWITDEIIFTQFTGSTLIVLPIYLSWLAILIDYLELPVIFDTLKRVFHTLN